MFKGTYGYELRKPIHDALKLIQDYINGEKIAIECTTDEYSVWESNERLTPSYLYLVSEDYPRHIDERKVYPISDVIVNAYRDAYDMFGVVKNGHYVYRKHEYDETVITLTLGGDKTTYDNLDDIIAAIRGSSAPASVYIGSSAGVTSIESNAFKNAPTLIDIRIPKSVIHIGRDAFEGTAWLDTQRANNRNLVVVNGMLIDAKLYDNKEHHLYIRNGIYAICDSAVKGNTAIESVSMANSMVYIGDEAFESCSNLKDIRLPLMIERIGSGAFDSTGLKSIYFPGTIQVIPSAVCMHCLFLEYVEIGNGVTEIGPDAFYECEALEQVNIPKTVETIWNEAFYRDIGGIHQYIYIDKKPNSIPGAPWGAINKTIFWTGLF